MRLANALPWLVLLPAPLAAQGGTIGIGDHVVLPSTAPGPSDHAIVSINSAGDILVAWSSKRDDFGVDAAQVEAVFLPYIGGALWRVPTLGLNHFVLGAADAGAFGSGFDSCRKPDVCSIGSNFYVTWPRSDQTRVRHQLEVVRVRPDGSGGALVDAPGAGIGYVVDPAVDGANAGIMPDLVSLTDSPLQRVGVVYVDDEKQNPPYREYDLRFARVDFATLPPSVEGPAVLENNLPYDDPERTGEPAGGKVLPDVVLDDHGNMVVAFEAYLRYGHQGSGFDEGQVRVLLYSNAGVGIPRKLDDLVLGGYRRDDRTRRPNLAASRLDGTNTVSLAYLIAPDAPGKPDIDVQYSELTWDGTNLSAVDRYFPNVFNRSDTMPSPAHGSTLRACVAIHSTSSTEEKLSAYVPSMGQGLLLLRAPVQHPWRPSVETMEPPPPDMAVQAVIPISYEAPTAGGTGPLRIYLVVQQQL